MGLFLMIRMLIGGILLLKVFGCMVCGFVGFFLVCFGWVLGCGDCVCRGGVVVCVMGFGFGEVGSGGVVGGWFGWFEEFEWVCDWEGWVRYCCVLWLVVGGVVGIGLGVLLVSIVGEEVCVLLSWGCFGWFLYFLLFVVFGEGMGGIWLVFRMEMECGRLWLFVVVGIVSGRWGEGILWIGGKYFLLVLEGWLLFV